MRTKFFFPKLGSRTWLIVIAMLASACSGTALSTPNSTAPQTSELVIWERSGGIAGICQRMVIQDDRTYTVEDCIQDEIIRDGQVAETDWNQLSLWLQEYQPLEWRAELPPGSADMFNDSVRFSGSGSRPPTAAQQEDINIFLADLFARLSDGN